MAVHLHSANTLTSIAAMAPYHCWMSKQLLGRSADEVADEQLRLLAHQAYQKLLYMDVLTGEGELCSRPS